MNTNYKQLTRSTTNRMIAGLCAGIGDYANIDPTVVRLGAVLLLFLTGPGIIAVYLIMALIVPQSADMRSGQDNSAPVETQAS